MKKKLTKASEKKCADVINSMDIHLNQIERLLDVTHACQHGLYILTNAEKTAHARVQALKALITATDIIGPASKIKAYEKQLKNSDKEIARAQKIQSIAQKEKDNNYTLLFSFSLISLWSILESMTKEFLASWIKANPKLLRTDKIANIKLVLGEYEPLSASDKIKHILSIIDRNNNGDKRLGICRFENIFSLFELGGDTPKKLSEHIFEFQQVRNSLAHDGFISGKQLKSSCPWLFKARQKTLRVDGEMFHKYALAAIYYCILIKCRAAEYIGKDKTDIFKDVFNHYGEEK